MDDATLQLDAEQAAREAARNVYRGRTVRGIGFDDHLQEARIGIWRYLSAVQRTPAQTQFSLLVTVGTRSIIDALRRSTGRGERKHAAANAEAFAQELDDTHEDVWLSDPQALVSAAEEWGKVATLPISLQILVVLLAIGYTAREIGEFAGFDESRVSVLRARAGELLAAMA